MTRVAAPEPTTAFVSAGLRHMVGRRVRRGGSGPPRTCPPHGRRSTHEAQPRPAHHEPVHLVAGGQRTRPSHGRPITSLSTSWQVIGACEGRTGGDEPGCDRSAPCSGKTRALGQPGPTVGAFPGNPGRPPTGRSVL